MYGEVMQKKNWIKSDGCASVYFHVSSSKGLSKLLHDLVKKAIQIFFFFLSGFSFTDTDNSQDSRGREGTFLSSTLPLPPAHEHSDIYVQFR